MQFSMGVGTTYLPFASLYLGKSMTTAKSNPACNTGHVVVALFFDSASDQDATVCSELAHIPCFENTAPVYIHNHFVRFGGVTKIPHLLCRAEFEIYTRTEIRTMEGKSHHHVWSFDADFALAALKQFTSISVSNCDGNTGNWF